MTISKKHKYKRIKRYLLGRYGLSLASGLISFFIIIFIDFTEFRPFGYSVHARKINNALDAISLSLLSAIIIIVFNDMFGLFQKHSISIWHIERQLKSITATFKSMIDSINPFNMQRRTYAETEFIKLFREKNLYDNYYCGKESIIDAFNRNKEHLTIVIEGLLSSYSDYLSKNECKYLRFILESYFFNNTIQPIDFSIDPSDRIFMNENQEEIGRSLYQLYYTSLRMSINR